MCAILVVVFFLRGGSVLVLFFICKTKLDDNFTWHGVVHEFATWGQCQWLNAMSTSIFFREKVSAKPEKRLEPNPALN